MLPSKNSKTSDENSFQADELSNLTDGPGEIELERRPKRPKGVYSLPFARVSKTVKRYRKEEEENTEVDPSRETFDWDAIGYDESSSFFDNSSTLDDLLGVKSSQRVNREASSGSSKVRYWLDRKDLPHPSKLRSSGRDRKRKRRDDNHVQHHVAQLKKKRTDFDCFRLASTNATDLRVRTKRDSDSSVQEEENFQPSAYSVKSTRDMQRYRGPKSPLSVWNIPGHCRTPGVQQVPTMSPAEPNFLQYSTDLDGGSAANPCFDQASYWTETIQVTEPQQNYYQQDSSEACLAVSQGLHHFPHSVQPGQKTPLVSCPSSADVVESPTCIINPDPLGILATMRQRGPEVFQRFMNLYTEE